jgi:hypothetical protein
MYEVLPMLQRFQSIASTQGLTNDQLRHYTPSVFTSERNTETTSDRYTHIPTLAVIEGLAREGFIPVKAMQCKVRNMAKREFTKHMLRFRHVDAKPSNGQGGLVPELVLVNSHDGLSSYQLMAGIFRIVCANGLVSGEMYDAIKVRHKGDIVHNVIEASYSIVDQTKRMLGAAERMGSIELLREEAHVLGAAAHQLVFTPDTVNSETGERIEGDARGKAITVDALLRPRRTDDTKRDLFTTFNVIQENVLKGGRGGYMRSNKQVRYTSMREVKSIDRSNALNRALWTLAERMAELKAA